MAADRPTTHSPRRGSRGLHLPQLLRPDAKYSAAGGPNRDEAGDGKPAGDRRAGEDGRPAGEQPEDEDEQQADGQPVDEDEQPAAGQRDADDWHQVATES